MFYTFKFEYDNHKNLIKETNISPKGSVQVVIDYEYKYDEQERIIKLTSKKLYGGISIYNYTYNQENGQLEKMIAVDGETNEAKFYYEYEYVYGEV